MNIQQLRQSVKIKWLSYYQQNRSWLEKIRVWGTYNGLRRPSSGFILATLSVLEPQFQDYLSFIVDLNSNPDQIVTALGLNFNPDQELDVINSEDSLSVWERESLPDNFTETKAVPLVATPRKIPTPAPLAQSVPRYTNNHEIIPTQKVTSSVAVATKVASPPIAKTPYSTKIPVNLLRQYQPVGLPPTLGERRSPLAMTMEVIHKAKTLPYAKVRDPRFDHLPMKFWTLLLQKNCLIGIFYLRDHLKPPISRNQGKISPKPQNVRPQVTPLPSTHSRSLASWIDEFCQGRDYNPEESIYT
jgi:hypothetical protein